MGAVGGDLFVGEGQAAGAGLVGRKPGGLDSGVIEGPGRFRSNWPCSAVSITTQESAFSS